MKTLNIDIETRSSYPLKGGTVYHYVEAPDFEILLFAYSVDGGPIELIDLKNGDRLPDDVFAALSDPKVEKRAFNAAFERVCLDRFFGIRSPVLSWRCSSVLAASHGLPGNLRLCAVALKLDVQKMKEGEALIKKFTTPRDGDPVFFGGPDWKTFGEYCVGDVAVEMAVFDALKYLPTIPMFETNNYHTDQRINDRGVAIDVRFAMTCVDLDAANADQATTAIKAITGVEKATSNVQLKKWLSEELHAPVTSLNKKEIEDIDVTGSATAARVLELRQEISRSSVSKFKAMIRNVCDDGRLRGVFRFYGAQRTGRYSSKIVQLQNLPSGDFAGLDQARRLVMTGDLETIQMIQESVSGTLSALVRTALIAPPGKRLVCADYSSIEARVLAWLAGETWVLEVFAGDGKIYEAAAARMFGIDVATIDKKSPYRKKGKVATLACGYGGGAQALINMGALREGLVEEELEPIKKRWRAAHPNIVAFWKKVEVAALTAVRTGTMTEVKPFGLRFLLRQKDGRRWLYIHLPSGRCLAYFEPVLMPGKYGDELTYLKYGSDDGQTSAAVGQERVKTYGAKLVENIVQAIARDCLCVGLWHVETAGYPVVLHVHDEIVAEVNAATADRDLDLITQAMTRPISWANGLTLAAEGFHSDFYRKEL